MTLNTNPDHVTTSAQIALTIQELKVDYELALIDEMLEAS
jgi:hypothetical protein